MAVTLQQLEVFRVVARNLSFSLAAREVYTSQPHVSNQIRKLEEHYRVPLFIRSRPGISLTEAGTALYERINSILADIEEAEQVVQQFRGLHRGSVRLAATSTAGNHILPAIVADFLRSNCEIVVTMNVSNTEDVWGLVERDEAEVAVTPLRPLTRDLTCEPFFADDLVVALPRDRAAADPITVGEFATLPLVAREDGSMTSVVMQDLLEPYETNVVARLSGTTAVNEAVAAGAGASLVPLSSIRVWRDAGLVTVRRLVQATPRHHYFLVHSHSRYLTPATRALIDHLRDWQNGADCNDQLSR
ncbi:DNA-binding transcriptional LysR family regulator [Kribbella aluminosa]|uniref:DNA-binding transcriptional LysR family regulator n=1 Tax=Kribbella aluminosa TaxID=416017 RepID=A0ABS4UWV2_9ACTN|nr:LysR family transcriptional regulator [Kribbella aluminosa]MBP2356101.1 DNA-binding transcriptional LysR family regulator [Kribbella aluminosa]